VSELVLADLPACRQIEEEMMANQPGFNTMTSSVVTAVGQYTLVAIVVFTASFVALLLVVNSSLKTTLVIVVTIEIIS
jgi:hypothetical protein